jgi:hypothetical protein
LIIIQLCDCWVLQNVWLGFIAGYQDFFTLRFSASLLKLFLCLGISIASQCKQAKLWWVLDIKLLLWQQKVFHVEEGSSVFMFHYLGVHGMFSSFDVDLIATTGDSVILCYMFSVPFYLLWNSGVA